MKVWQEFLAQQGKQNYNAEQDQASLQPRNKSFTPAQKKQSKAAGKQCIETNGKAGHIHYKSTCSAST